MKKFFLALACSMTMFSFTSCILSTLVTVGVIAGVSAVYWLEEDDKSYSDLEGTKEITESFGEINIAWYNGKINIILTDDEFASISETNGENCRAAFKQSGNSLDIKFNRIKEPSKSSKELTVKIPKTYSVTKFNIAAQDADTTVEIKTSENYKINIAKYRGTFSKENGSGKPEINIAYKNGTATVKTSDKEIVTMK